METKKKLSFQKVIVMIMAVLWLFITGVPFLFMMNTGLKDQFETLTNPIWALPQSPKISNFVEILTGNFFVYFKNSVLVVTISVFLIILISSMAAYVLSRFKFKLNKYILLLILAGMAVPMHVTLIPIYLLTNKIGIYDSIFALIGPYVAMNIPLSVFILTEFMRAIPKELEEAARIDGCSSKRIFWNVILPLSKPGIATLAIYNSVVLWNEFSFALVLTASQQNRTLPLGIWEYQGQYSSNIPMIMAILTLATLPMILVYLFGQEKMIKGMMAGALKG